MKQVREIVEDDEGKTNKCKKRRNFVSFAVCVCVLEEKSLSKVYKHKKDENTMDVFPCLLL